MRRHVLFLMVVAMAALAAATSQAALMNSFSFDVDANDVVGTVAGTLVGTTVVPGQIGNALDASAVGKFATIDASSGFGISPNFRSGEYSASYWIKVPQWVNTGTSPAGFTFSSPTLGYPLMPNYFGTVVGDVNSAILNFQIRPQSGSSSTLRFNSAALPVMDDQWHQLVYTFKTTDGASGTGAAAIYLDGVAQATTLTYNGISSTSATGTVWNSACPIGADVAATGIGSLGGLMDDLGFWGGRLSATEVMASFNLGKYGVSAGKMDNVGANALFALYAAGTGTTTAGGQTWQYVAGGLADPGNGLSELGGLGGVGADYVVLGANGAGVQIVPEPGTLSLLLAGAVGLLVFAWRKRK